MEPSTSPFDQLCFLNADVDGTIFPRVCSSSQQDWSNLQVDLPRSEVSSDGTARLCNLTPESLMIDFEIAARNAVREIFPNTTVRRCFFPFTQCVLMKVHNCGLAAKFRENDYVHQPVRELPFPFMYSVIEMRMCGSRPWRTMMITPLQSCVSRTTLPRHGSRNIFSCGTTLTTTDQEPPTQLKDHKLDKMCRCVHPNIYMYVFIEMLPKEQTMNEAKTIHINAGGVVRPKKRKYRQLDSCQLRLNDRLLHGELNVVDLCSFPSYSFWMENS